MKPRDRELTLVVGAALLASLPFLGAAFHVDEPFFLDRARELLSGAEFVPKTWADRNNNPPVITWLLAAATSAAGEREAVLRALLLPSTRSPRPRCTFCSRAFSRSRSRGPCSPSSVPRGR
ncbi:MAG: hypothetical protein M0D55_04175 [Elusimicrobiota bacterium]|nr:MAG: hypothetical protein M0D55_04175 [Elusimicrobiota bacterium]